MADKRPAPEPDPDEPERSTAGPFLGALAVVVVLILVVVAGQVFGPSDESLSDSDLVSRTVDDYVRAHNTDDDDAMTRLRCAELPADQAPLADVDGEATIDEFGTVDIEGDRGRVETRTTVDGEQDTVVWSLTRVDGDWRICTA
ncbi:hypothetical protein I0Q12_01860 [Rhodococcus sp. CX]|uniref:Rv0361 family membrane protein n=1 Tax=Rhodococcus sp. CX TaxID=2789880 RepID=UPI0018CDD8A2|nr:hypothetical protein [Rhodococcus sp. CX]MBH0118347.1 hypothetical protein [Rhodococcus sp. CX]